MKIKAFVAFLVFGCFGGFVVSSKAFAQTSSTSVVSASPAVPSEVKTVLRNLDDTVVYELNEFKDSSFWTDRYKASYCFNGFIADVCATIGAAELKNQAEYTDGGHDYFKIQTCSLDLEQEVVRVQYILGDDYSSSETNKTADISRCSQ
jgi:hypothetical protein